MASRTLRPQKQLYFVSGNLDEAINGSTSWGFEALASDGEEALRIAHALAKKVGYAFTMELVRYGRAPRVKGGMSSDGRISR